MRTRFLLLAALVAGGCFVNSPLASAADKPNFVVIVADGRLWI